MRLQVALATHDIQRSLAIVKTGKVFLDRKILDQERDKRTLAATLILETGDKLALIRNVLASLKLALNEVRHNNLLNSTIEILCAQTSPRSTTIIPYKSMTYAPYRPYKTSTLESHTCKYVGRTHATLPHGIKCDTTTGWVG